MPTGARGMQVAGATNAVPPLPRLWRSSVRSFHAESLKKPAFCGGSCINVPLSGGLAGLSAFSPKKCEKFLRKGLTSSRVCYMLIKHCGLRSHAMMLEIAGTLCPG